MRLISARRDLLIGGDKTGNDRWYETYVPVFKKLQVKMPRASRARSEAKAQKMIKEMALDELRAARDLTQEHLSEF